MSDFLRILLLGVIAVACGACWQIGYQFALRSQKLTTVIVGEDERNSNAMIGSGDASIRIIDGDRDFVLLPHKLYMPSAKSVVSEGVDDND